MFFVTKLGSSRMECLWNLWVAFDAYYHVRQAGNWHTCVYGLEVRYNDKTPLRCFSRESGGVWAHLYTAKGGQLRLDVSFKMAGRRMEYSIPTLVPGDALSCRFLRRARTGPQSIARCAGAERMAF